MNTISYKSVGDRNFMTIPCTEAGRNIETQIKMLSSGEIRGILPVTPTSKNGIFILQYDITGFTRLSSIIQYEKLSQEQFSALIDALLAAIDESVSYALSPKGICLDNDCVFFDTKQNTAKFAYVPTLQDENVAVACREFLRVFIAYGKVEQNRLTAVITDVINDPSFNLSSLKEAVRQFKSTKRIPAPPVVHPQENNSRVPVQPQEDRVPPQQANAPFAAPVSSAPAPKPTKPAKSPKPAAKSDGKKSFNLVIIIAIVLVSIAAIIGACSTSVVRLEHGGLDVPKVLGLCILFGAVDFLIIRKLPQKSAAKEKPGPSKTPAAVQPAAFPSAPPLPVAPQPTQLPTPEVPAAAVPARKEPAFASVPAAPSVPAQEECDYTVVFDEPEVNTALYLQTAAGENIPLSKSPFLLGRDKTICDWVLNETTVGRRHAELQQQGDRWLVTDLNSRNHTYLNDAPLEPYTPYLISAGDVIRCAKMSLRVKA